MNDVTTPPAVDLDRPDDGDAAVSAGGLDAVDEQLLGRARPLGTIVIVTAIPGHQRRPHRVNHRSSRHVRPTGQNRLVQPCWAGASTGPGTAVVQLRVGHSAPRAAGASTIARRMVSPSAAARKSSSRTPTASAPPPQRLGRGRARRAARTPRRRGRCSTVIRRWTSTPRLPPRRPR
jgi:hypothetical protein